MKIIPTWRNGRAGPEGVRKRPDRFLASFHLIPLLGSCHSWTQPSEISDHYPVRLERNLCLKCHLYPFKFNRAWLLEAYFDALITTSWIALVPIVDPMFDISYKFQRLKNTVKTWEKQKTTLRVKEISKIDLAIISLLLSHYYGILSEEASTSLTL